MQFVDVIGGWFLQVCASIVECQIAPPPTLGGVFALGLRHVGYAIPTELFGPFVIACVQRGIAAARSHLRGLHQACDLE